MMKHFKKPLQPFHFLLLLMVTILFTISSCKKDSFITSADARLTTSTNSLQFDTVFTSIGSITQSFKINNPNNQKLNLTHVKLMGGAASAYKININGIAAAMQSNIELAANDSMYVFVSVNINPNLSNLPFIVKDSIEIAFNGNSRFIQLEAFGQNANFLRNRIISGNINWRNNLPYVILGSLQVDTNAILNIDAGCRIYAHANAPFLVDGTLLVNGNKSNPVIFTGDRLDTIYNSLPASWPGIYFRNLSKNNLLKYAIVKNAYQAIVAENPSGNTQPKVTLQQCIVDNAYDAGLYFINSSLLADNSLITNCGNNISFVLGGSYSLTNCTVASYSTFINHKNPVLAISNFGLINAAVITKPLSANFTNCIFWGEDGFVKNEIIVNKLGADPFNVSVNNCLYRATEEVANCTFTFSIKNQNPLFDSVNVSRSIFDFHNNNPLAPGINKGIATIYTTDLDGKNRNIGLPDLGCYEKQ